MAPSSTKVSNRRSKPSQKTGARKPDPHARLLTTPSNAVMATVGTVIFGAGLAAIGYALMRHGQEDHIRPGSAARREDEGDIRNAGQESMRTGDGHEWTNVDESSDESFPASDPPGTY